MHNSPRSRITPAPPTAPLLPHPTLKWPTPQPASTCRSFSLHGIRLVPSTLAPSLARHTTLPLPAARQPPLRLPSSLT